MYKVKFTWLWKELKILLEKGCDFSKSLEPNTVLSYKTFTKILNYLQSHLN